MTQDTEIDEVEVASITAAVDEPVDPEVEIAAEALYRHSFPDSDKTWPHECTGVPTWRSQAMVVVYALRQAGACFDSDHDPRPIRSSYRGPVSGGRLIR